MTPNAHTPETVLVTGGGGFLGSRGRATCSSRAAIGCAASPAGAMPVWIRSGWSRSRGTSPTGRCSSAPAPASTSSSTSPPSRPLGRARTTTTEPTWSAPGTSSPPAAAAASSAWSTPAPRASSSTAGDLEGVDESAPYPERYTAALPVTKAAAEQAVVRAGGAGPRPDHLPAPAPDLGPGRPALRPAHRRPRASRLRRIGDGRNLVDTTYIDNAAEAHLLAADRLRQDPGALGPRLLHQPGRAGPGLGHDRRHPEGGRTPAGARAGSSHGFARALGWAAKGRTHAAAAGEPPMTRFVADALARSHWFDIGAARRDLGYSPSVSTAEGLERLTEWFTRNPPMEPYGIDGYRTARAVDGARKRDPLPLRHRCQRLRPEGVPHHPAETLGEPALPGREGHGQGAELHLRARPHEYRRHGPARVASR